MRRHLGCLRLLASASRGSHNRQGGAAPIVLTPLIMTVGSSGKLSDEEQPLLDQHVVACEDSAALAPHPTLLQVRRGKKNIAAGYLGLGLAVEEGRSAGAAGGLRTIATAWLPADRSAPPSGTCASFLLQLLQYRRCVEPAASQPIL